MRDRVLVSATVVTDDDTGMYGVGDLDFSVPATTGDWLDAKPERAEKLAAWLEWLAGQCRRRESPFDSWAKPVTPPPVTPAEWMDQKKDENR